VDTRGHALTGLTAAAIASLLLTGCSSSKKAAAPVTSQPPSAAVTTSAGPASTAPKTTPPTVAATRSAAPTTPVEPATLCRLSELAMTAGMGDGAAGSVYQPILFRNSGTRSCQLQGYPGVAAMSAAGTQASQAVRTASLAGSGLPATVTLTPGSVASAVVRGSDVPSGNSTSCPSFTLLVTPPGETHSQSLPAKLPGCQQLQVGFIVTGTTGQR
jgi:hypothetical protein